MDPRKINYHSWKKDYLARLDMEGGRHGSQDSFYRSLLCSLFENNLSSQQLEHFNVDNNFISFFIRCSNDLRCLYVFDHDIAKANALESQPFQDFLTNLKQNGYLWPQKIKKIAPHIAQDIRTSTPQQMGFFAKINQQYPDYFGELAKHLEPLCQNAKDKINEQINNAMNYCIAMRPLIFDATQILYTKENGTHLNLKVTDAFSKWFNQIPLGRKIPLKNDFVIFKVNENAIAINKGANTPGIQIQKHEEFYLACNNMIADRNATQAEKKDHLKKMLCVDLHYVISGENITELETQIERQVKKYEEQITKEKQSMLWVNKENITLWENKRNVLNVALHFLRDTCAVDTLKHWEEKSPEWDQGKETKALVDRVKILKRIPLDWNEYTPPKNNFNL